MIGVGRAVINNPDKVAARWLVAQVDHFGCGKVAVLPQEGEVTAAAAPDGNLPGNRGKIGQVNGECAAAVDVEAVPIVYIFGQELGRLVNGNWEALGAAVVGFAKGGMVGDVVEREGQVEGKCVDGGRIDRFDLDDSGRFCGEAGVGKWFNGRYHKTDLAAGCGGEGAAEYGRLPRC